MHSGRIAERRFMGPPRASMEAMVHALHEQSQEDQIYANSVREVVNSGLTGLERVIEEQARMRKHAADFGDDVRREAYLARVHFEDHARETFRVGLAQKR